MAHNIERSLSSLTAIAAASLLLSTTPVLAQSQPADAQPPAAAPASAPAVDAQPAAAQPPAAEPQAAAPQAAAQPAVAAPATAKSAPSTPAPTMTTTPVVQAIPDSSQTAATPAPQTSPAPTAARTATQTRAVTRTARTTPAPQTSGGIPAATPAQKPEAAPATAKSATDTPSSGLSRRDPAGLYNADGAPATTATAASATQTVTRQSPYARYWPLEAAGGIVLIGLIGYAFTRRREDENEEVYTPATFNEPVAEPVATNPVMPVMATAPAVDEAALNEDVREAAVLPAGPVPSGAEREALLHRMVEAQPDAANPFHTVKARLRRARLILASRKQALRDQATEAFDWRTYRPSLQPATLGGQTTTATIKREPVK